MKRGRAIGELSALILEIWRQDSLLNYDEIAQRVGCSRANVSRVLLAAGIRIRRSPYNYVPRPPRAPKRRDVMLESLRRLGEVSVSAKMEVGPWHTDECGCLSREIRGV